MTKAEIINRLNKLSLAIEGLEMDLQNSEEEKHWTKQDVEYAKTMKQLFPDAYYAYRSKDGSCVTITGSCDEVIMRMYDNPFSLGQLRPGEYVALDDIIGGSSDGNQPETLG